MIAALPMAMASEISRVRGRRREIAVSTDCAKGRDRRKDDAKIAMPDVNVEVQQGGMGSGSFPGEGGDRSRGLRVRVVFEGGGAKGISHVGALKALEEAGFEVVGYAGTSAGAIVAALAAAGMRADDMFDPVGGGDLLKTFETTPLALLGTARWWSFRFLQSFSIPAFNLVPLIAIAMMALAIPGMPWFGFGRAVAPGMLAFLLLCLAVPTTFFVILARSLGFLGTERIGQLIDRALARSIDMPTGEEAGSTMITFGRLHAAGGRELKIIATDLTDGELAMFDASTPDVGVGAAVAASAAIPIVFRPVEIPRPGGARLYVDGGLVSNLPCWAFAEDDGDRSDPESIPVVAFRLGKGSPPRRWPFLSWLKARWHIAPSAARAVSPPKRRSRLERHLYDVFETGMFGSQRVVERLVPGLHVVELRSTLSTYDFDASRDMLSESYEVAKTCASTELACIQAAAGVPASIETSGGTLNGGGDGARNADL